MILRMTLAGLILCLSVTAHAQTTVLGTAQFEGRSVELLSDNTWRYADEAGDCLPIEEMLTFCGPPTRWQRAPVAASPAVDAFFQVDDRNFGMVIAERLGREDGLTDEALREAVLLNAGAAGNLGEAPPVDETYDSEIGDALYPTISYRVRIQGIGFTYLTTLLVGDRDAAQLTTYAIANELSDDQRALHADFLSHIRLEP